MQSTAKYKYNAIHFYDLPISSMILSDVLRVTPAHPTEPKLINEIQRASWNDIRDQRTQLWTATLWGQEASIWVAHGIGFLNLLKSLSCFLRTWKNHSKLMQIAWWRLIQKWTQITSPLTENINSEHLAHSILMGFVRVHAQSKPEFNEGQPMHSRSSTLHGQSVKRKCRDHLETQLMWR